MQNGLREPSSDISRIPNLKAVQEMMKTLGKSLRLGQGWLFQDT